MKLKNPELISLPRFASFDGFRTSFHRGEFQ
jgi:hypothetical protein